MSAEVTLEDNQRKNFTHFFRGNLSVIAISNAIRSLSGFVGIYIPLYFVQIGGNPLALGLLASAVSLIQFFTLAIGGFIADYYGRRKVIVFGAFYGVFFPLLYAAVQDWRLFGALSLLATIGTIASPAINATVVDSIPPERRTTGIAFLQVVSSLPSVLSPLIGGWLIETFGLESGFRLACIYAAAFSFISAIPVFVFLRETLNQKTSDRNNRTLRDALLCFANPSVSTLSSGLKILMFSYALVMFSNGAVGQYYILYAARIAGISALDWGVVVSLQLLLAVALKIPGGWLGDRFGKRKLMLVSLFATLPAIMLFTLSRSFIQVVVAALLLVATGIYYAPAYEALQADFTPRSVRGRVTALGGIVNAFSFASGALLGGFTFHVVGPAMPFYVFAFVELGAALLLVKLTREPETKYD